MEYKPCTGRPVIQATQQGRSYHRPASDGISAGKISANPPTAQFYNTYKLYNKQSQAAVYKWR